MDFSAIFLYLKEGRTSSRMFIISTLIACKVRRVRNRCYHLAAVSRVQSVISATGRVGSLNSLARCYDGFFCEVCPSRKQTLFELFFNRFNAERRTHTLESSFTQRTFGSLVPPFCLLMRSEITKSNEISVPFTGVFFLSVPTSHLIERCARDEVTTDYRWVWICSNEMAVQFLCPSVCVCRTQASINPWNACTGHTSLSLTSQINGPTNWAQLSYQGRNLTNLVDGLCQSFYDRTKKSINKIISFYCCVIFLPATFCTRLFHVAIPSLVDQIILLLITIICLPGQTPGLFPGESARVSDI